MLFASRNSRAAVLLAIEREGVAYTTPQPLCFTAEKDENTVRVANGILVETKLTEQANGSGPCSQLSRRKELPNVSVAIRLQAQVKLWDRLPCTLVAHQCWPVSAALSASG